MTDPERSATGARESQYDGLGILSAILVEGLLIVVYALDDAPYHGLIHLYSGGAAELLAVSALHPVLPRTRHPLRRALVATVAGHLVAATPDLLFAAGRPHEAWMNLFLGHLVIDQVPGRATTLLAALLAALAAYLVVHARSPSMPEPS